MQFDSDLDQHEEPSLPEALRRLADALRNSRQTIVVESKPTDIDELVRELESFATDRYSRVRFVEDVDEFESAIKMKRRELLRGISTDEDDTTSETVANGIVAMIDVKAKIVFRSVDTPAIGINLVFRLHDISSGWIEKAKSRFGISTRLSELQKNILGLRLLCGFTWDALADEAGKHRTTLFRWRDGESEPDDRNLNKLSKAFGDKLELAITSADMRTKGFAFRVRAVLERRNK